MLADAERQELLVVDASVLVSIVASPAERPELIARLGAAQLHAPAILQTEVDSALRGLELGGKLSAKQAAASRQRATEIPLDLWPWAALGDRAWELRHNLTTYDAGYVALAEMLGATLVTGDRRIAAAGSFGCAIELV